jgi:molecular chaperone DnaJ
MDLYAVLGVTRAASRPELERAYRRLQRRYHPGVNPGDRVAETMYRQIQEAFDILGDVERRRQYDSGQSPASGGSQPVVAFEGFDFSAPAEGPLAATFAELFSDVFQQAAREATTPSEGGDLSLSLHVPFAEAMRGCRVPLSVTRRERCAACSGAGRLGRAPTLCAGCRGEGVRRWARGHMVFTKPCEVCEGTGQTSTEVCRYCRGDGAAPRTEVISVVVPAGIESGSQLTVPGHGHAGARSGSTGDLLVTILVGEHRAFRRAGRDLHLAVPVTVAEAVLGAEIEVPTLGAPVRVAVPAGSSSGRQIRLPGLGIPASALGPTGDLVLTLSITLPSALDAESVELIREFGRRNVADVRQELFD